MTRRQTRNAFAWWRGWWKGLSEANRVVVIGILVVLFCFGLTECSSWLWSE